MACLRLHINKHRDYFEALTNGNVDSVKRIFNNDRERF